MAKDDQLDLGIDPAKDKLQNLREIFDGEPITGWVYKVVEGKEKNFCGKIDDVLDPHDFGVRFGPGKFEVKYRAKESKTSSTKGYTYNISNHPYKKLHEKYLNDMDLEEEPFREQNRGRSGNEIDSLLRILDQDKIKGLIALVASVKAILNGGGQNEANNHLFQMMQAQQAQQAQMISALLGRPGPSDTLITKMLEIKQPKEANPFEATKQLIELSKLMSPGYEPEKVQYQNDDEEKGMLPFMMKLIADKLPDWLESIGGKLTPEAMEKNKLIKDNHKMIEGIINDPNQLNKLYQAVKKKHGETVAIQCAEGLGVQDKINQEQPISRPKSRVRSF